MIAQQAWFLLHVHGMLGEGAEHLAVPLVPDGLRQVLEVAAADDVQELEAAADGERRDVARERAGGRHLPRVAMLLRGVGLLVPLGPVHVAGSRSMPPRTPSSTSSVSSIASVLGGTTSARPPARSTDST